MALNPAVISSTSAENAIKTLHDVIRSFLKEDMAIFFIDLSILKDRCFNL
jgi:hypothetical protein